MFLQESASTSHSGYHVTYNCVANKDNQYTFNDGYHIQHHLNSQLHWSELPQRFLDTLPEHGHQKGTLSAFALQRSRWVWVIRRARMNVGSGNTDICTSRCLELTCL